jgi:hypothetical protein
MKLENLLKSRYREFLIDDKSYNQQTQHIEIYDTSQLVNFFTEDLFILIKVNDLALKKLHILGEINMDKFTI